jgi:hypothetical protein
MSTGQPTPPDAPSVQAEGFRVSIPADVIARLLTKNGTQASTGPIQINLGGLHVTVPATLLESLASQLLAGHAVALSFSDRAIRVQVDNLPAVRLELPADGITLKVASAGLHIQGTGA